MVYLQSYIFIYHPPPVRHRRGSGAAREPDGLNSFLHMHDSAPAHPSTCLSLSTALQTWGPPLRTWTSGMIRSIQPPKQEIRRERSALVSAHCAHVFYFFVGHFWAFLLLCQHMLCIRMYAIQFISLYFVPLSSLLITSILSLKCNYGRHVMFSMEMHSVQKAGRDPSSWQRFYRQRKTKTCSKNGWQSFLCFWSERGRTRILTSVLSRNVPNRQHTVTVHRKCC